MLTIECKGLQPSEAAELRELLRRQSGVTHVEQELKLEGMQRRSFGFQPIPDIWFFLTFAAVPLAAAGAAAGKTITEEATKDLYKEVKEWFSKRNRSDIEVTLYGPDDRPIQKHKK